MSLKSKAKQAKKRAQVKAQVLRDTELVKARAEKLKTMTAGFARTERSKDAEAAYAARKMPQYARKNPVDHAGDLTDRFTGKAIKDKPVLDEDMQKRDKAAHQRTHEIMKRVDVAYNKGGLMLLSESEFEAMKKGELKRRS